MFLASDEILLAVCTVFVLATVSWLVRFLTTVEDGSMDEQTLAYLKSTPSVPLGQCEAMVKALEGAPFTEVEAECAEQMRGIVAASHIPYSSLIDNPETLLRCSEGHATNGALWTRFTVQFNLFAGSIVALGSDEQREKLVESQSRGMLGCFAFTEKGAGVLSGAGVETTATFDPLTDTFVLNSPQGSGASKTWISQGLYAEQAVILAELLVVDGETTRSFGPHLFWADIADLNGQDSEEKRGGWFQRSDGATAAAGGGGRRPVPRAGVTVTSLPPKTALKGLDNAFVTFEDFRVPRKSLLSRFCELEPTTTSTATTATATDAATGDRASLTPTEFEYRNKLPPGVPRMLDLLIFRLLTGRIVLSEATTSHALHRLKRNWAYCGDRKLWQGKRSKAQGEPPKTMADMPLIRASFRDYGRSCAVVARFIAHTREQVAECIRSDRFTHDVVEAACICKFLGTGFGVDTVSAVRKTMGARALQEEALLDKESFLPNACCAAEGDNTIMELKVVQDLVRGRTPKVPIQLMWRVCGDSRGRTAVWAYLLRLAKATYLGRAAMKDGQLLKDIAWARAHMRVVDVWLNAPVPTNVASAGSNTTHTDNASKASWLESYDKTLLNFPAPLTC